MIARLHVLLPHLFVVPIGLELAPIETELRGYRVRIHLPAQPEPIGPTLDRREQSRALKPAEKPVPSTDLQLDDGNVVIATLLVIDVLANDFDRRLGQFDPPIETLNEIVNDVLARFRSTSAAPKMTSVALNEGIARIRFLNDDGSDLALDSALQRTLLIAGQKRDLLAITPGVWATVEGLPASWSPFMWDVTLLDAGAALPHVGSAIVLAHTAIEVFAAAAIDRLARDAMVSPLLWEWLNDRGNYLKDPSAEDQLDVLLNWLTGKSLKDAPDLWRAYGQLRNARNKFAHEGVAKIEGVVVTLEQARELLDKVFVIFAWVEELLPEDMRRTRWGGELKWTVKERISAAAPQLDDRSRTSS